MRGFNLYVKNWTSCNVKHLHILMKYKGSYHLIIFEGGRFVEIMPTYQKPRKDHVKRKIHSNDRLKIIRYFEAEKEALPVFRQLSSIHA